jgi:predicted nucleic acid-binding protein
VTEKEVLAFVEQHRLFAMGIGWIDAHLAASARVAEADLWTRDRALARCWARVTPHSGPRRA